MKSYWIETHGQRTTLACRELPLPEPGPDELLLKVHAAALNRGEIFVGGVMHGGASKPGGTEAAGSVHALGGGVDGFAVGERVMGRVKPPGGGFGEYVLMRADQAIAIPECLSWEEAAAIPVTYLVTYDMLYPYGKLRSGEWLLVTGISSGVGVSALQTAKYIGARVIGTSGSAEKLERLRPLGLDVGIRTRSADFAAQVPEVTGGKGASDLPRPAFFPRAAVNCLRRTPASACAPAAGCG